METVEAIIREVAERFRVAMGLPEGAVIIDRRTGELEGANGAVEMEGDGLTMIPGQGTLCADLYRLDLNLSALLDVEDDDLVFPQRLARNGAARAALTWRSGVGTPIANVGIPKITRAAVTEPFEPMHDYYGVALSWTCELFLPIGEVG